MKKLIFCIGLLCIGFSATAQNADKAYQAKVQLLVDIKYGPQNLVLEQIMQKVAAYIPDHKEDDFKKEVVRELTALRAQTVAIYMETYTPKEVEALLEFYRSPIGREIRLKTPKVIQQTLALSQAFSQKLMPLVKKYM